MRLMDENHKTVYTHMEDPKGLFDLGKAKRSCKHCCGTGVIGHMHFTQVKLVCKCVVRVTHEESKIIKKEEMKRE